jgi:hypothetical protein
VKRRKSSQVKRKHVNRNTIDNKSIGDGKTDIDRKRDSNGRERDWSDWSIYTSSEEETVQEQGKIISYDDKNIEWNNIIRDSIMSIGGRGDIHEITNWIIIHSPKAAHYIYTHTRPNRKHPQNNTMMIDDNNINEPKDKSIKNEKDADIIADLVRRYIINNIYFREQDGIWSMQYSND